MERDSCVVVFPSAFAQGMMPLLSRNIKKILRIREQEFGSVKRDGPAITVDASDPVFASSAIALLFGVRSVAIAVRADLAFDSLAQKMAEIGANLLLSGDRFLVKVEGVSRGFVPKDLEAAATSAIIEKASKHGVRPGTEGRHDKLLRTFLANRSAYVSIFSDEGLGGLPYGAQGSEALCCIFNELSAVSCLETIRQGYRTRIAACYRRPNELTWLAKTISRIVPRMVSESTELDFFRVDVSGRAYTAASLEIARGAAEELGISHVSLPLSPLAHPAGLVDGGLRDTMGRSLIPVLPLGGMDEGLLRAAREIGLEWRPRRTVLRGAVWRSPPDVSDAVRAALGTRRRISIRPGPNNVHDILDLLRSSG